MWHGFGSHGSSLAQHILHHTTCKVSSYSSILLVPRALKQSRNLGLQGGQVPFKETFFRIDALSNITGMYPIKNKFVCVAFVAYIVPINMLLQTHPDGRPCNHNLCGVYTRCSMRRFPSRPGHIAQALVRLAVSHGGSKLIG